MPSPIGHVLAGAAVYLSGTQSTAGSSLLLRIAVLGSIVPDLDFLPGIMMGDMRAFHHGISHTFPAALCFGILVFAVVRSVAEASARRAAVLGALAYISHVLLDFVSVNPGARGVPLLWPFSSEVLGLNLQLFGHFRYTDIRHGLWSVVRWDNVSPLLREVLILGGAVAVLYLTRRIGDDVRRRSIG